MSAWLPHLDWPALPFPIEWLPRPAYLVGGAVRDSLMGRQSHIGKLDLDLVLEEEAINWASSLARQLQGGFVVLDSERQIARVVLPHATLDLALQAGKTLEADLHQRDFTCNAIAVELHTLTLLDPLHGLQDIERRWLRMIHPDNLSADPLRLLRGYRQSSQLQFELEPLTHQAIRERAPQLSRVAGERVRTEISYLLLQGETGLAGLQLAWQDGMLAFWLPCLQEEGFDRARRLFDWIPPMQSRYPYCFSRLHRSLCDSRTVLMTLLLVAVLSTLAPQSLQQVMDPLRFSRHEHQWGQKLLSLAPQLIDLAAGSPSAADQHRFFQAAGEVFPGLALLALAMGCPLEHLDPWLVHYDNPTDPVAHPVPLLDGQDLMQTLGIPSGPQVGAALAAIRLAQAEGQVGTTAEALAFASGWFQRQSSQYL